MTQHAKTRCRAYRKRILDISQKVGAIHIAPAFSCLEILDVLYNEVMTDKDTFILSKGHGAIAQYVILESLGIMSSESLDNFCSEKAIVGTHPDRSTPGVWASTGSLGHGLGMAVGMAYAHKLTGSEGHIFVVCSDGELQEGSTWEAVQQAYNLGLNNLTCIVDNNGIGGMDLIPQKTLWGEIFRANGWVVKKCNGHDADELKWCSNELFWNAPLVVIADTIKGKGVSYMEGDNIWHYRSPNDKEYKQALKDLGCAE